MASNPFFSGRIPPELYQKAVSHCEKTGDSKTDLLVKALSAYLEFPVELPGKNFSTSPPEVTKEMFESLEERVKFLEELLKLDNKVIINDKADNNKENEKNISYDNALQASDNTTNNGEVKEIVIGSDNNSDNQESQIKTNETETTIPETATELPKFKQIITAEVITKTNLNRNQIKWLMDKAIEKVRKEGNAIKPGELLKEPIEVSHKSGIKIGENPYKLFYVGENSKERPVWNLVPDNTSYQPVFIKTNFYENNSNDKNYEANNKIIHQEDNG